MGSFWAPREISRLPWAPWLKAILYTVENIIIHGLLLQKNTEKSFPRFRALCHPRKIPVVTPIGAPILLTVWYDGFLLTIFTKPLF